jgi:hypothetical protein
MMVLRHPHRHDWLLPNRSGEGLTVEGGEDTTGWGRVPTKAPPAFPYDRIGPRPDKGPASFPV